MGNEPLTFHLESAGETLGPGKSDRIRAIAEVLFAFITVHAGYRALKYFTPFGWWEAAAGQNFIPGTTMILFTVLVLWLCGRSFESYGLSWKHWRYNLNVGLTAGLLVIAGLVVIAKLLPNRAIAPRLGPRESLIGSGAFLLGTWLLLWMLKGYPRFPKQISPLITIALLIVLICLPVMMALHFKQPLIKVVMTTVWSFFCAGFGEEIFFRGYIQSRINHAFGHPFHSLGIDFGPGLILSSFLFGSLHVLNTCDYYHGHFEFAWWFGLMAFCSGLFQGSLREKTGGVLAGGIAHGLEDVLTQLARFF